MAKRQKWWGLVKVTPELLRDPVALSHFMECAEAFAPPGAIDPVIERWFVGERYQDPNIEETVFAMRGTAVRPDEHQPSAE